MKIRVLEVVSSLSRAGAENVVSYLASGFDRARFQCAVASLYDPRPNGLEGDLRKQGVPIHHLGKHPGLDPRIYIKLRNLVREFQPDIIHSHCYVLRYLLHLSGSVMAHTVHNMAASEVDALGRMIHRYAYFRGVVPIAVGTAVANSFRKMYGFAPRTTIPNGIDTNRFWRPEVRNTWRRANGFREDELLVVSTGRLAAQKNPIALANAIGAIPGARLLLAGDGVLRSSLEGRERVHLLGVRNDVPDVLAAADIFALASDWEGLPLAVIEAMAAGLPVVATNVGSVSEAVYHGRTGLLVPAGDQHALTESLRVLVQDETRRRAMGEAGRALANSFSVGSMVGAYEDLFTDLMVGRPRRLPDAESNSKSRSISSKVWQ